MAPLDYDNLTDAEIDALAEQLAAQASGTATTVNENGEYPQIGPDGTDCGEGYVYRGGLGGCTSTLLNHLDDQGVKDALTALANAPGADFLDLGAINVDKPPPVVEGSDGQMYRSNPQLTPNGWTTNPDYSTPVYFFHAPLEAGDAREIYAEYSDDLQSATQQGYWRTEEEIRRYWEGKKTADNPGQLNMQTFREQHPNMTFEQYMAFIKENSALHQQGYTLADNPELFSAITDKYGVKTTFTNSDGDIYGWNGSNYTKTYKVDESFDLGGLLLSVAAGVMTGGLMSSGALGTFLKGLSGFQKAAVINGVTTAIQSGGDIKAIAGSMVGTFVGGQLGSYVDLGSAAANSALSSSIASAVEQGIVNGEIDFNTMITSGLLGGAGEIGKDLVDALIKGNPFDFGGLLGEDTALYEALNGVDGVGGLIGDIRGQFDEFVTKYIDGGEWFTTLDETDEFKDFTVNGDGTVTGTRWDGTSVNFANWDSFENAVFSTKRFIDSPIWNFISQNLTNEQAAEFYQRIIDWMNNSGGADNNAGGTITSSTDGGDDGTTPSDDFDCSSVNRQQVQGATTGTECGPCIEGYEANEFGECVETLGGDTCPEGQYYNEVTLQCEDEVFFTPGQPCNTADGQQGIFDDEGGCYVPAGTGDGTGTGDGDGDSAEDDSCSNGATVESGCEQCEDGSSPDDHSGGNCGNALIDTSDPFGCAGGRPVGPNGEYTFGTQSWDRNCGESYCYNGTPKETIDGVYGANCAEYVPPPDPVEQCSDPDRRTNQDGSCAELCNDGTIPDQHEGGLCGGDMIGTGEPPVECDNGATIESNCSECADGTLPEDYEDGKCPSGTGVSTGTDGDADCTLVECEAPRPEGEQGVLWDKCCTDVTTTTTSGGADCTLVECESPRPEGDLGAIWDECCTDTTTATTGSSGSSGGPSLGGGNLFEGVDLQSGITRDPSLEVAMQFPITNFLAGIFTNSTGGRNV